MRVEERILSILLAEKIKENPMHARKIGVEIVNNEKQKDRGSKNGNKQ